MLESMHPKKQEEDRQRQEKKKKDKTLLYTKWKIQFFEYIQIEIELRRSSLENPN